MTCDTAAAGIVIGGAACVEATAMDGAAAEDAATETVTGTLVARDASAARVVLAASPWRRAEWLARRACSGEAACTLRFDCSISDTKRMR